MDARHNHAGMPHVTNAACPTSHAARFQWLTPAAPAAIAVVRVPPLAALCDRALPASGHARFVRIIAADGRAVDEAVAVRDADGLELMVHGGPGVRAAVTAALESHGLYGQQPTATPSDHWSRLAAAVHPAAVVWLLTHAHGEPPFPAIYLERQPVVLITGATNAGKSTLLNAWCGHQRALVSDLPGTTRDLVAASTLVEGWRLRLVDSAGLRPTDDALEAAGQALVERMRARVDLVLHLGDGSAADPGPRSGDLVVRGKADLSPSHAADALCWSCHGLPGRSAAELLMRIGHAVLARLGLPAGDP